MGAPSVSFWTRANVGRLVLTDERIEKLARELAGRQLLVEFADKLSALMEEYGAELHQFDGSYGLLTIGFDSWDPDFAEDFRHDLQRDYDGDPEIRRWFETLAARR
jgi:hypothetical protein